MIATEPVSGIWSLFVLLPPILHRFIALLLRNLLFMRSHTPKMPKRVNKFAISITPKHIHRWHCRGRAFAQCLLISRIHIIDINHRTPWRRRPARLRSANSLLRTFISEHQDMIANLQLSMRNLGPIRIIHPHHLLCAEDILVKLNRPRRIGDDQARDQRIINWRNCLCAHKVGLDFRQPVTSWSARQLSPCPNLSAYHDVRNPFDTPTERTTLQSRMRIGINTFLFTSPFTNESTKLFPQFKRWGFDTVEIPVEDPSHIDPAHVKRELDKHKLVCGSVCACMGPDRDLRGTPENQKTGLDYMMNLIDQMVVLNCPCLIGPVYSAVGRADAVPPDEYKQQWTTVVGHLKTLCKYAEEHGKQVCLEPLNRFETDFINTCDQALKMVKDVKSPALKLHLDTFHMNIEQKNQAAAIRKAGKLLGHFHACGSDRGTPGNDHIDWKPIAKALKDVKYKGDVVIESFTTDVKVIARAAAIWRRIEPTRNEIAVKGLKFLRKTL